MSDHLRAASRITIVTLGSRVLGFVRDVIMVQMLGFTGVLGTFALAWMVPNLLRRLFGEGALSASFIPAYARTQQADGPEASRRLLGSVTGMMLLVLGAISGVVMIACMLTPGDWIDGWVAASGSLAGDSLAGDSPVSEPRHGELLLQLTTILFPYAIPICLAAIFAGALNTHGIFALPAASPIVLNCVWIGALGAAALLGLHDPTQIVTLVAVCLLVGGVAQMCLSLVPLLRRGLLARPRLPERGDPSLEVLRNMGPTVIGMSLVQINTMMDQGFAYLLVDAAGPSFIYVANRLLLFPHALTSLALATAIFPRFAQLGNTGDRAGLRRTTDQASHHTLLVAVPAAVGMMLIAGPLVELMFASEQSTAIALSTATTTTMCLVASLPAIGVAQLHARALYALGDYRTPAWMSFWLLLLNLVLNVVFVVGLDLGVPGLALATAIASYANAYGLRRKVVSACHRDAGEPGQFRLWPTLAASAAMAAVVYGLLGWFEAESTAGRVLFDLALPVGGGMLAYGGALRLLGQRRLRMR